jgi:hypothetical protein
MAKNINLETTTQAWADIVIKNWQRKMIDLNIGSTGALFDSFVNDVISNTKGNPERIEFAHEFYGNFVDMGVGKGVYIGNPGDVTTTRKAKPWRSKVLFSQTIRLSELISEKFGIIAASVIRENVVANENKSPTKGKSALLFKDQI